LYFPAALDLQSLFKEQKSLSLFVGLSDKDKGRREKCENDGVERERMKKTKREKNGFSFLFRLTPLTTEAVL
jgi:hypothetical protein